MGRVIDFNLAPRATVAPLPQDNDRRLDTLRATLKARAPDLVREIFPAARIQGGEARIGDVSGAPGESMAIQLTGEKAGQWFDHANGEGGDLIDFWRMGQGYNTASGFWDAVGELELHLGLAPGAKWTGPVHKVAQRRAAMPKAGPAFKTGEVIHVYTSADGSAVLAKVIRREFSDGSKSFGQRNAAGEPHAPAVRPLYRLPVVAAADLVVLVEGEKCADVLEAMGVAATTVMQGSNVPLETVDFSPLAGKQVITWADNDATGRAFMEKVGAILRGFGCSVTPVSIPAGAPPKWDVADTDSDQAFALLREARDRLALLPTVIPTPAVDRSMKLLTLSQLAAIEPPKWLIHEIIPEASFTCVVGPPGGGKTFAVIDLAMCIAHGLPWKGRAVIAGPVVYVAGEGQAGIASRLLGWRKDRGLLDAPDPAFHVLGQAVAMPTGELQELIGLVLAMQVRPRLIVLDTVARNFGSGDENSSTDMGAFVRACDELRHATGACVLVVHHSGKDLGKGSRGSSALPGAIDCMIAVKRSGPRLTLLNKPPFGKQKDAEEFEDVALITRKVFFERHGVEVSTLVIDADESVIAGPADPESAPASQRLGSVEKTVLSYLTNWPDNNHGLTTIHKSLHLTDTSALRSLRSLVAKGRIVEMGEGGARRWSVVR